MHDFRVGTDKEGNQFTGPRRQEEESEGLKGQFRKHA